MEVIEVVLYGERAGLGLGLESNVPPTCQLQDPPVVTHLQPSTAASRFGSYIICLFHALSFFDVCLVWMDGCVGGLFSRWMVKWIDG